MTANKKKKRRKAFWSNIKFKYRLTITNENTLEDIVTLRVSKLNGISVLLSVLTVLFLIASLIVAFTPLRNYLPGYMNSEIRAQVVENALRVDSLQQLVDRQNLYIMNIQDIFQGRIKADTVHSIDSLTTVREDSLMERTQREAEFRKQYEVKFGWMAGRYPIMRARFSLQDRIGIVRMQLEKRFMYMTLRRGNKPAVACKSLVIW